MLLSISKYIKVLSILHATMLFGKIVFLLSSSIIPPKHLRCSYLQDAQIVHPDMNGGLFSLLGPLLFFYCGKNI